MQWEAWYTLIIMVTALCVLASDVVQSYVVTSAALALVWGVGIINDTQALSGFSNHGVIAIACLFVIMAEISRMSLVKSAMMLVLGEGSARISLMRLQVVVGLLSGFLNNTPVVALLIPIVRDWSRDKIFSDGQRYPPSKFLLPMSYATIAGGLVSMIGTSTNLIIQGGLEERGLDGMGLMEISFIGLPMLLVVICATQLWIFRWLPNTVGLFRFAKERGFLTCVELSEGLFDSVEQPTVAHAAAYMGLASDSILEILRPKAMDEDGSPRQPAVPRAASATVLGSPTTPTASPQIPRATSLGLTQIDELEAGNHAAESAASHAAENGSVMSQAESHTLIELDMIRPGEEMAVLEARPDDVMARGDCLVLTCSPEQLAMLRQKNLTVMGTDLKDFNDFELMELVMAPTNRFIDQPIWGEGFRRYYGCKVLAVRRAGENVLRLESQRWQAGDTALIVVSPGALSQKEGDFMVTTTVGQRVDWVTSRRDICIIAFFFSVISLSLMGIVSFVRAMFLMVVTLLAGRFIEANRSLSALDGGVLLIVSTSLGFAHAVETSGLAEAIASQIVSFNAPPIAAYFLSGLVATIVTEAITNNAAAAVMLPIVLRLAEDLGVSWKPFAVGLMVSCSTSFANPVGYATNTMVYGPGGYKFRDFLRVGLPLDFTFLIVHTALVPLIWPF